MVSKGRSRRGRVGFDRSGSAERSKELGDSPREERLPVIRTDNIAILILEFKLAQ